jgi:hypothetical protein
VQDVENYDPILNPVLNKELKRTGGRVLITLGDQARILWKMLFYRFLTVRGQQFKTNHLDNSDTKPIQ